TALEAGRESARVQERVEAELVPLRPADRATFHRAAEQRRAGQNAEAWKTATPLFAAYPSVYAVQDLRCQIAMTLGLDYSVECAPLITIAVPTNAKSK